MSIGRWGVDVRAAWRSVIRGGWSSLAAVAALALGIGASTTAAAAVYGGFLQPLPFPDDARLITIDRQFAPTAVTENISLASFPQWREGLAASASVAAYSGERVTLRGGGAAVAARAGYIVGDWFGLLAAAPAAGRLISEASPTDEVVASHDFAVRQGGGDPAAILGRTFTLGRTAVQIV